ncbi:MAG: hypothetical protein HXS46_18490 [Theionarchaea archaeon]|nr:hypothetical protein [Theionarchaea archaeon]
MKKSLGKNSVVMSISVQDQALLLIIMENGQKSPTQEEIRQRTEEEGIYFSDFKISKDLRELEAIGLVRFVVYQSMERWYPVLEVA